MRRSEERIAVVLRRTTQNQDQQESLLGKNRQTLEAAFGLAKVRKLRISVFGVTAHGKGSEVLQEALDLGCDAATAISVPLPFDFFGEALLLRAAIAEERCNLVLCPDFDEDCESGDLAAALAFMLDLPGIAGVSDCRYKGDDYLLTRRSDWGHEQFRCPRPALLALVDRLPMSSPARSPMPGEQSLREIAASDLLDDLSVLYSRSSLAMHAAPKPTRDAPELLSDPSDLLARLQSANLWNAR